MSQGDNTSTPTPTDDVNARMDVMQKAITDMSSVFRDYLLHQNNNNTQQNTSGNSQQTVDSREGNEQLTLVMQFQNMNPPSFKGVPDPTVTESWVKKLEKMFKLLKCTDEGEKVTWDKFVQAFYRKYLSKAVLERKELEFMNLKKARKFQKGLKASIRNKVVPQMLKIYDEVLTTVQIIEQDMDEQKMETHDQKGKGRATNNQPFNKRCSKNHGGKECYWKTGACFKCGKTGHLIKDCLILKGRVEGRVLLADLILLGIVEFDVILGMDWLSTHYAMVDCYEKVVTFSAPNQPMIWFEGEKVGSFPLLLSCMQADKMLQHECYGYLAYVFESKDKLVSVEGIWVVEDFPDVFPKELPGLPPDREIEFTIDLVPGTSPISQQPYRMAPT
ncbi:hypothetical protein SLEP1_g23587 [Rubroshorea leprosula]|uniref:CCHC-type domain-containing protein n=1 Tax=Rubroshorea leprosula TaxID=152421 RepID=A0AAV5JIY1_9ROSI|nr:hypothetical protein SLEP1_g23587 [Rubroshorea leprosula]